MPALDYLKSSSQRSLKSVRSPKPFKRAKKGLSKEVVLAISQFKKEPQWMTDFRLECLDLFYKIPLPSFGPDLSALDFDELIYYASPEEMKGYATRWEDVPDSVKETFERLGIPQAEREVLAGAGAQYDSLNAYHKLKETWGKMGVIFEDMDQALKHYPELVKKYFMKGVPPRDHKFAALHGAVWSGGTFLYVPKGVQIKDPLQAYFRMNTKAMGQFEHSVIVVEDGASAHYIEGCSAPKYNATSLHAGCVEIFVKPHAKMRYSSVENWSLNTYNLNTKRAIVEEEGTMEWVSGNLGSGRTMLYPCSILKGRGARADHWGVAIAGKDQVQDIGSKVIHAAPETTSTVLSKSISKQGGVAVYRGLLQVNKGAKNSKASMRCDGLILDNQSRGDTIPTLRVNEKNVSIAHEATVGKISEEQLFYLRSRGLSEEEALAMIVNGFIEPVVRALPLEYAVEMNRLIAL
ncbi:MAG: Fe-S cluster assembly protein SufB [Candidatus Gracilibacteria bacterium]